MKAAQGQPRSGGPALPCLSSHISTEGGGTINKLTGSHKRTAHVLAEEIINLAKDFGIEHLGFLTLTFADYVTTIKEAQRRFNSLNTHVLKARCKRAIGCWERHKSGRIHFHLVVVLDADIRTGIDFDAIERRDYRSASAALRAEWSFWRRTAPLYRFGRTELLPVKSTAEGIARYVGKYVSKHIGERWEQDRGARVVRYIGFKPGTRRCSSRFSWNSDGAWLWRLKLSVFAERHGFNSTDDILKLFGPRWAYMLQASIIATELPVTTVYPSFACAIRESDRVFQNELIAIKAGLVIGVPLRASAAKEAEHIIPSSEGVATVPVRCGSGLKEVPLTTCNQLSNLRHDV